MRTIAKLALGGAAMAAAALAALPAAAAPAGGHFVGHGRFFGGARFGGPRFAGPGFRGWYGYGWPYWYGFYSPFWWGYPYYAYPGAYDYPPGDDGYGAGPQQAAPDAGPAPNQSWYYCSNPQGYYPYVQSCTTQWQPVPPTPPQGYGPQGGYGPPPQGQSQGPAPQRLQP